MNSLLLMSPDRREALNQFFLVNICKLEQVLYNRTEAKKPGFYENIGFGNETSRNQPGLVGIVRSGPYFQLVTFNSQLLTVAVPITKF